MSNVIFTLLFYLKVAPLPGFPLEPGGPRFPFWPGMITPGQPGGPGSPATPGGPLGPTSPTVPFLPGMPGKPGDPLSPLAPAKRKVREVSIMPLSWELGFVVISNNVDTLLKYVKIHNICIFLKEAGKRNVGL